MTEEEIRRLVRKECADIIDQTGVSEDEIIVKSDQVTKEDIKAWGVSSLTPIRKVQDFLVLAGKAGSRVIRLVVIALGVWGAVQFGSELIFEKSLPDANELARQARQGIIQVAANLSPLEASEPERFITVSTKWRDYTDPIYARIAHDYLAGTRPTDELYTSDTEFIPLSGVSEIFRSSSSSSSEDFKTT